MTGNLFDLIESGGGPVANDTWRPEAPPCLDGEQVVFFNFESNGLRWFDLHEPISLAIWAKGRKWYLPWKHAGEGNLPEEQVYRFAQKELAGKHLVNINTRFDIHMGRKWGDRMGSGGLDFEAMGCSVSDVGHLAALLDDHRFEMNLDALIRDYVGVTPMPRLDESRMASFSAGAAAPRAMYNVEMVKALYERLLPDIDKQGLSRIRKLEDEIIFVVCEMERNGVRLDMELLERWIKETKNKYHHCVMELFKETGLKINPNSPPDQAKLFRHLNIKPVEFTATGAPSFTDDVIKHFSHPTIRLLRRAKKYKSLHSKFSNYRDRLDSNGVLRYALHQLRTSKSEDSDGGETGTVVGRFTSTEITEGVGVNIQQVMKLEKQFKTYGDEYLVRDLYLPEQGYEWLSADAEQVQYRLFANEAQNPTLLEAYSHEKIDDPKTWISYHKMMWARLKLHQPGITYRRTKDTNFAKLFAAGPNKLSLMLEFTTKKEFLELAAQKANRHHPKLAKVAEILKIYDKEVPEVTALTRKATKLAEERGYIKSIMGRRMRFPFKQRTHKALNGRIIMSEADIVKTKMVELHKARKYTDFLLRFQVHDEVDGDARAPHTKDRVGEVLNSQSFPSLAIKILWGVKTGESWGACAADELKKLREEAALEGAA